MSEPISQVEAAVLWAGGISLGVEVPTDVHATLKESCPATLSIDQHASLILAAEVNRLQAHHKRFAKVTKDAFGAEAIWLSHLEGALRRMADAATVLTETVSSQTIAAERARGDDLAARLDRTNLELISFRADAERYRTICGNPSNRMRRVLTDWAGDPLAPRGELDSAIDAIRNSKGAA